MSFDVLMQIGDNPLKTTSVSTVKSTKVNLNPPIYRTWTDPNSPINIDYEWPVYYALNKWNSTYQMTKPAKKIDLNTYNITLPGYLPGQFYVDPRTYITNPPTPIPSWEKQNISFKTNYPKSWSASTIEQAKEDEFARY